jgi:hypothetical protein
MKVIGLYLLAFLFLCCPRVSAGEISRQGVGQASFNNQSKKDALIEATNKAKLNALSNYVSGFDIAKSNQFDRARPVIESSIDRFVVDYVVIEDVIDNSDKTRHVIVRAMLDPGAIERELSKVTVTNSTSTQQNTYMTFVFVAREVKSQKKFDTRRTVQFSNKTSYEGGRRGSPVRPIESNTTDGGSSLKKTDEIQWTVSTVNEINTAMNNVFTSLGYEVIDAVDVYDASKGMLDTEKFINDYKKGDDISPTTRRAAISGCKAANLDYFATGTLDIGVSDTVATGLERVYVSVTGKIWSIKTPFPKVVASVGPVQSAGLGPDQRVAKLSALKAAGEMVARELTSQMRMKGIQ